MKFPSCLFLSGHNQQRDRHRLQRQREEEKRAQGWLGVVEQRDEQHGEHDDLNDSREEFADGKIAWSMIARAAQLAKNFVADGFELRERDRRLRRWVAR